MKRNDPTWNPWHGCHKFSEGCKNCFMYYLDEQRGQDGSKISKNKTDWNLPLKKDRQGNPKIKSGEFVRVCMASDFFLEEADEWREEAWNIMRKRPDVTFSLLTKRAHRIKDCLPADWGNGWDNITFAVSCENQKRADERIPYLLELPAKHIWVSLKPFIGEIDLDKYLATGKIETVLCGGENYAGERPLHHEWVKKIYDQCIKYDVEFIFGQTGNVFIKDGKEYHIKDYKTQIEQALASGLQNRKNPNIIEKQEQKQIIESYSEQLTLLGDEIKMTKEGIIEFIKRQKTSIISSVDDEGYPWTRALIQPRYIDGNDIYFATYTSSNKVKHYHNNSKASIYFYEKGRDFQGVMIKGTMEVLIDQETKDKFWMPFYKRFYKKGVTDPEYCILKFTCEEAEWFSNFKTETIKMK